MSKKASLFFATIRAFAQGGGDKGTGVKPPSLRERLRLAGGKLRRVYYAHTPWGKRYIEANHRRRSGECARCGACCQLAFRCPHLELTPEGSGCRIHDNRFQSCRLYPMDEADLRDRDIMAHGVKCGYRFK